MSFQTAATATAPAPAAEPQPVHLDFYCIRDDMFRAYQPATEEERFLVTQIARAWHRLQRLCDAENVFLDQQPLAGLLADDPERFKTLHRSIAEAERMWRHAVQMYEKARSRRERTSLASPRRSFVSTVPTLRPVDPPASGNDTLPEPAAPTAETPEPPPQLEVTKQTQTPTPGLDAKRSQLAPTVHSVCSHTSTPMLQSVEKRNTPSVDKCKGGLN